MNIDALRIRYIGDTVLKNTSERIDSVNDWIKKLSSQMIEMMHENNGIGLAAPQIGYNIQLVTIDIKGLENDGMATPGEVILFPQMPLVLINPEIIEYSEEATVMEEGCLSIPGVYATVQRSAIVSLRTELLNGEKVDLCCGGFLARVLQHEIDHLNGILFVDKLEEYEQQKIKSKLKKLDKKLTKKKLI